MAQTLAGVGLGEAGEGADLTGLGHFDGIEPGAGVQPHLGDLLLHRVLPPEGIVFQGGADLQGAAGDLHVGQTSPLGVPGDLKDPGTEILGINGIFCKLGEAL